MDRDHLALLKLHLTKGIGRVGLFKLYDYFGDFCTAASASSHQWQEAGLNPEVRANIPLDNNSALLKALDKIEQCDIHIVPFWDQDYPPLLRHIYDPPALLYLRGRRIPEDCFAIVGSRRASAPGMIYTREIASDLARHDICVVSGLARGIDSAAHHGAVNVAGRTVAVLGCGVDIPYPRENRQLFESIAQHNTLISEYPPGTPPIPGHFPGRNRIISGISKGVLIVEASEKSGSLITGEFALEQGKELFAIPGTPRSPHSKGTNKLLKEGAQLVTEAADILHLIWPTRSSAEQRRQEEDFSMSLDEPARSVFSVLGADPLHSDEIARKCGLTPMELSVILLDLELQGRVQALPGHHYIRNRL